MRKSRIRALKTALGRAPRGVVQGEPLADGRIPYIPSERRRLKKAWLEARRAGRV